MSGSTPPPNDPGPLGGQPRGPQYSGPPYPNQPYPGAPGGQPQGAAGQGGQPPQGYGPPPSQQPPYGPGGQPRQGYGPPQGYGRQQPPYGPGQPPRPGQPGGPPRKSSATTRNLIIVGAIVLALIIGGVVIGVVANRNRAATTTVPGGSGGGSGGGSTAPVPTTAKASDAAKAYLEALAAGQAETAIALAETQPADKTFLTDAVLAESNKLAPMSAINVPEVTDEYAYQVPVTYKLGGQPVSTDIAVSKAGDSWRVQQAANDISLSSARSRTLPMLVNKVPVKTSKISLFPGTYSFTTGAKYISYGSSSKIVVQSPSEYPRGIANLEPTLSDDGEAAFIKVVKASVRKCLKSDKLAPDNCPNQVRGKPGGYKFKDGTIDWTGNEDAVDNARVRLDYDNPTTATASIGLGLRAEGDCNSSSGRCYAIPFGSPDPNVNMTKEPLEVVWK